MLDKVRFVVLDEADEMLRMGFIDDVESILGKTPSDLRPLVDVQLRAVVAAAGAVA